jgi:hypothetical protein
MKQRFEKYDFDVVLLEVSYVSGPNVRRALIEDGNDAAKARFIGEHDAQVPSAPGGKTHNGPVPASVISSIGRGG